MPNSAELGAGDVKVLKSQYNDLRDDVLDTATGHDHTGAAGHGKQLDTPSLADLAVETAKIDNDAVIPAKIPNRTRTFFIPAVGKTPIHDDAEWKGYKLSDGVEHTVLGWSMVPSNFVSGLTIKAVIISDGTGAKNAMLYMGAAYGACAQTFMTHFSEYNAAALAIEVTEDLRNCVMSTALGSAAAGDIIAITLTRYGADVGDTVSASVYCPGFIAEYTADS